MELSLFQFFQYKLNNWCFREPNFDKNSLADTQLESDRIIPPAVPFLIIYVQVFYLQKNHFAAKKVPEAGGFLQEAFLTLIPR